MIKVRKVNVIAYMDGEIGWRVAVHFPEIRERQGGLTILMKPASARKVGECLQGLKFARTMNDNQQDLIARIRRIAADDLHVQIGFQLSQMGLMAEHGEAQMKPTEPVYYGPGADFIQ